MEGGQESIWHNKKKLAWQIQLIASIRKMMDICLTPDTVKELLMPKVKTKQLTIYILLSLLGLVIS